MTALQPQKQLTIMAWMNPGSRAFHMRCTHGHRAVRFAAAFAAALTYQQALCAPVEALIGLRECPARGQFVACLPVEFSMSAGMREKVSTTRKDRGNSVTQVATIRGRRERRSEATYRLRLRWQHDDFAPDTDLGALAYVGQSKRNRPIILTNKGPLEVSTSEIEVADDAGLVLLDDAETKIRARYIRPFALPFVITRLGHVAVWDRARNLCVAAPQKAPGPMALLTNTCKAAGAPGDQDIIGGNIVPLADEALAYQLTQIAISGAYPGDAAVFSVPNAGLIVVVPLPGPL